MCSTPFAGTSPPKPYLYGEHAYGFRGWVQLCEGTKAYHPWEGVQHVDFWAANLYPGRDFGPLFESYAQVTNRSLMVSEFGVDAYDTNCRGPEYPEVIGCEDQASQAEWVMSLIEGIEKNAVTCTHGCESISVAGGSIMAWVDEWWKGDRSCGPDAGPSNGYCGRCCPDLDASAHRSCGPLKTPPSRRVLAVGS